MSEEDKLAYLYYVAGCLRIDKDPMPVQFWRRFYAEFQKTGGIK